MIVKLLADQHLEYVRPAMAQPAHMRSLIRAFASCLTII